MRRRLAWLHGLVGAGLLAGGLAALPAQAWDAGAEDAQLSTWVRRGNDRPDEMMAELLRRWPAHAQQGQPRERAWLMAKGQILVAGGQWDRVDAVASRLYMLPGGADYAWLLRAQLQDRQGKPPGSMASRALAGFEKQCQRGDEANSVAQGCDHRATVLALRLLERDQSAQGAYGAGEVTLKFALALARAGRDREEIVTVLTRFALLHQAMDQQAQAQEELATAAQEAQGEPVLEARVHAARGVLLYRNGDPRGSLAETEAALPLAERAGAVRAVASLRTNLVDSYLRQGRAADAIQQGQLALPVLQRFKDLRFERVLRHNLALAHIKLRQFDVAHRELAKLGDQGMDASELVPRARELVELAEAWAEVGQYKEALAAYNAERELSVRASERSREAALEELRRKYDSTAKQRDLELLARDSALKDQQLANRNLAQRVGIALGALLTLSLVLGAVVLMRSRRAQQNLQANQTLLRTQSERDPLTGLSNRRHFLAVMEQQARADKAGEFRGALLMIDIDHFKVVNDKHGHAAGDSVIVEVARRINHAVRASDLVVRWGGEEFLVFAPELSTEALTHLAERILQSIGGQPIPTETGPLAITASVGFASFPLNPALRLHWEQAVNWADMALYKAKAEGRNRAIGVLSVQGEAVRGEAPQDFDAACQRGDIQYASLAGPTAGRRDI